MHHLCRDRDDDVYLNPCFLSDAKKPLGDWHHDELDHFLVRLVFLRQKGLYRRTDFEAQSDKASYPFHAGAMAFEDLGGCQFSTRLVIDGFLSLHASTSSS